MSLDRLTGVQREDLQNDVERYAAHHNVPLYHINVLLIWEGERLAAYTLSLDKDGKNAECDETISIESKG